MIVGAAGAAGCAGAPPSTLGTVVVAVEIYVGFTVAAAGRVIFGMAPVVGGIVGAGAPAGRLIFGMAPVVVAIVVAEGDAGAAGAAGAAAGPDGVRFWNRGMLTVLVGVALALSLNSSDWTGFSAFGLAILTIGAVLVDMNFGV